MNEIRPNLYIGCMEEAQDLEFLKLNRITAVLNVAQGVNDPDLIGSEVIANVKIGLGDFDGNKPYLKDLAVYALKMMLAADERVLVHCRKGISRAVWVVCRTIADLDHTNPDIVLQEVITKRSEAQRGPLFEGLSHIQSESIANQERKQRTMKKYSHIGY